MLPGIENSDGRRGFEYEPPEELVHYCPVCDAEVGEMDDFVLGKNSDHILGCSRCTERYNAIDWFGENL